MPIRSAIIGKIGEDIACKFLASKGYVVIERNYLMKLGEIDIICKKNGIFHFIEVKSVSHRTFFGREAKDQYNPEDKLHLNKAKRLKRVITAYLGNLPENSDFAVHLVTVKLNESQKEAHLQMFYDIIL